jgi:hypothetical protein
VCYCWRRAQAKDCCQVEARYGAQGPGKEEDGCFQVQGEQGGQGYQPEEDSADQNRCEESWRAAHSSQGADENCEGSGHCQACRRTQGVSTDQAPAGPGEKARTIGKEELCHCEGGRRQGGEQGQGQGWARRRSRRRERTGARRQGSRQGTRSENQGCGEAMIHTQYAVVSVFGE